MCIQGSLPTRTSAASYKSEVVCIRQLGVYFALRNLLRLPVEVGGRRNFNTTVGFPILLFGFFAFGCVSHRSSLPVLLGLCCMHPVLTLGLKYVAKGRGDDMSLGS